MNIDGVILAAGFSRRMGAFKPALPLGEKTILEWTIRAMGAHCSRIVVVAGYRAEEIKRITASYPQVEVVVNPDFSQGMFSSVKTGFARVRTELFFYTPGDCPLVKPSTYQQLLAAVDSRQEIFLPVFQSRAGHPVLLKSSLVAEILKQPRQGTLRRFIAAKGYKAVPVDDKGIHMDVDTALDYQRFQHLMASVRNG